MAGIQIKGLKEAIAKLDRFKQGAVKDAAAYAINQTVAGAAESMAREIRDVFDKPTPYAQKAAWKSWATPGNLTAKVYLANKERGKGALTQAEVLTPHIVGGMREVKNSERRLRRMGIMGQGQWIVPGKGAPRDQYGNISGPQIVRILSAAGLLESSKGSNMNQTSGSRKRKKFVGQAYVIPFVGVFWRVTPTTSYPVLHFTYDAPDYEAKRFDFNFVAENYAKKNFHRNFTEAMRKTG